MTRGIDPDLFAQLMKLSPGARADLLEFLGQTPLSRREARRLVSGNVANVNDAHSSLTRE